MRPALRATVAAIAVTAACFAAATAAARHYSSQSSSPPQSCTAETFRQFSAAVWDLDLWERGRPRAAALYQHRQRLGCAPAAHRHAMKVRWRADGGRYYDYRGEMLLRRTIEPYYGCTVGGCGWWAIPAPMVNCESGGGSASDNIYANLTGSYYPGMSKWEQSVAAHQILLESGLWGAWLQWETGCSGWPWGLA